MFIKKYKIIKSSNGYLYKREKIILVGKVITVHILTQKKNMLPETYNYTFETKFVHLIAMSQSNTSSL